MNEKSTVNDTLITQLGNSNIMIRRFAQDQLVQLGADAVDPLLISLSESTDYRQKLAIISVLETIGDTRAAGALIREMESGNLAVRIMSAEALGSFHTPEVLDALRRHLTSEDVMVQIWIVESLGKLGDIQAVKWLCDALDETTGQALQYSIIRALGKLGDAAAIKHIAPYATGKQGFVQGVAQTVLEQLSKGDNA